MILQAALSYKENGSLMYRKFIIASIIRGFDKTSLLKSPTACKQVVTTHKVCQ
jgi:hypothetical protein